MKAKVTDLSEYRAQKRLEASQGDIELSPPLEGADGQEWAEWLETIFTSDPSLEVSFSFSPLGDDTDGT